MQISFLKRSNLEIVEITRQFAIVRGRVEPTLMNHIGKLTFFLETRIKKRRAERAIEELI
jgi:hypothetical protein